MNAASALLVGAALLLTASARSDDGDSKAICNDAYVHGQQLRKDGKLRAALDALRSCSHEPCARFVLDDCSKWTAELTDEIPTVVIAARDKTGADVVAVRFFVDGELRAERLGGTGVAVDPGEHVFRFELASSSAPPIIQHVVLRSGEKNRSIAVTFAGASTSPEPASEAPRPAHRSFPTGALVVGGFSLAALTVGAISGISGVVRYNDLKAQCGSACDHDSASSVRARFVVADVALVIGVATAAVATVLFIARPRAAAAAPSTALGDCGDLRYGF